MIDMRSVRSAPVLTVPTMLRVTIGLLATLALHLGTAALAQSPQLIAREQGVEGQGSSALEIANLDVAVEVRGSVATTELTVEFQNPSEFTLEGEFTLDMPAGSVVTGYALDVEGAMIDGVLQARDRARVAYEARVAQGVDPGLVEVDFSDRFSTRVFPILPGKGRTIRVRFTSPLDAEGAYRLPLESAAVRTYRIKVTGIEPGGKGWNKNGAGWTMTGEGKLDAKIALDKPFASEFIVSEHPGKGQFFEYRGGMAEGGLRVLSGPLTVFWDRSVSRRDDALVREAQLLGAMAVQLNLTKVTVHAFDSAGVQTFTVPVEELAETLGRVRYGGATGYREISGLLNGARGTCVLFSDGRVTLGDREPLASSACQLQVVSSGKEQDDVWLSTQARALGGVAVDLAEMDDAAALALLFANRIAPELRDGSGMPIETRALSAPAGAFRLIGRIPSDGQVMSRGGVIPGAAFAAPFFTGPASLWAEQELAIARGELSPDDFAALAREWSVAVPGVSFVVLEAPSDYVEAGFQPPRSYPEDRLAEFFRLREAADEKKKDSREEHREELRGTWEARQKWWARTDFSAEKPKKPSDPAEEAYADASAVAEEGSMEGDEVVATGVRRSQPSQESPAPVAAMAAEEMEEGANIVVTATRVDDRTEPTASETAIEVAPWNALRPYIKRWNDAGEEWPDVVAATEQESGSLPLFYFDLGEWHFQAGRVNEARRAVASALDLPSRNNQTLEIVAQRLLRYGAHDDAIWLLNELVKREAERPQPILALALAHVSRAKSQSRAEDLVVAERLLSDAALQPWPDAYESVGEILLAEANAVLVMMGENERENAGLPEEFIDPMPVDLRVLAFWNTPRVDLDLWVTEPSEEQVGYSNRLSGSGGSYTHDLTNGYGPEEYQIRQSADGTYTVEVNSFRSDAINPNGPSTVTVRLVRAFGTPKQTEQVIDVEMLPKEDGDGRDNGRVLIGRFTVGE